MRDRFGATSERSMRLRFHTLTGGSTPTAQQPQNNIVRVATQALAAVLGGSQSLRTNGFDEAFGLPTTRAAKLALRTQQVIGYESGVIDTIDPLAGSYFVEWLTDVVERRTSEYLERIEERGRAVAPEVFPIDPALQRGPARAGAPRARGTGTASRRRSSSGHPEPPASRCVRR